MSKEKTKILIAAGGTGGHVYPAIAIADEIKKININTEFMFAGTKGKIEARVVPQKGYAITYIWISGFHRGIRLENLLFPLKIAVSLVQSFLLIKKFGPDIVVGTGGYVCGPVLYIAAILGRPIAVHESNSLPGFTTRMLSGKASRVFTSFEESSRWLKRKDNIECLGTPTRDAITGISKEDGIRFFNFDTSKKTVFVFGGSLGASSVNRAIDNMILDLVEADIQIIWQTGYNDELLANNWKTLKNCWTGAFIDDIGYAYAAADIVISRAGATTLAELTRLGKAAILIPYPYAASDHQTFNARTLVNAGAAVMIEDKDVQGRLKGVLISVMNDDGQRKSMEAVSIKLGKPNAGREIAGRLLDLAN